MNPLVQSTSGWAKCDGGCGSGSGGGAAEGVEGDATEPLGDPRLGREPKPPAGDVRLCSDVDSRLPLLLLSSLPPPSRSLPSSMSSSSSSVSPSEPESEWALPLIDETYLLLLP